jgi:hypothetical protein
MHCLPLSLAMISKSFNLLSRGLLSDWISNTHNGLSLASGVQQRRKYEFAEYPYDSTRPFLPAYPSDMRSYCLKPSENATLNARFLLNQPNLTRQYLKPRRTPDCVRLNIPEIIAHHETESCQHLKVLLAYTGTIAQAYHSGRHPIRPLWYIPSSRSP